VVVVVEIMDGLMVLVITVVMVVVVVVVAAAAAAAVVVVKEGPLHCSCGQLPNSLSAEVWKEWERDNVPQNGCPATDLIALAVKWKFVELQIHKSIISANTVHSLPDIWTSIWSQKTNYAAL
jgi:hypothetical protein